jgi:hypothetical protein
MKIKALLRFPTFVLTIKNYYKRKDLAYPGLAAAPLNKNQHTALIILVSPKKCFTKFKFFKHISFFVDGEAII